jgi:hypothetical protein
LALFTVVFVGASSANLAGSTFEGNDGNLVVNTAGLGQRRGNLLGSSTSFTSEITDFIAPIPLQQAAVGAIKVTLVWVARESPRVTAFCTPVRPGATPRLGQLAARSLCRWRRSLGRRDFSRFRPDLVDCGH